jgi:DNA-directed RNA polymerase specialized sigma24 family protein
MNTELEQQGLSPRLIANICRGAVRTCSPYLSYARRTLLGRFGRTRA